jgi:hypothetical protein
MLAAAHQGVIRPRLLGAAGLGLLVHAFFLASLSVVAGRGVGEGEDEIDGVDVVPVDEERQRRR